MISLQNLIGIKNLFRIGLFLILAFYSCKREQDSKPVAGKDLLTYNISLSSINPGLENFVKNAKIIPLEMNNQAVIAQIDRLIIDEDDMILFDSRVKQVLVYDTLGTHHSTIKKIGRGPSEYKYLRDIIYDKKTKSIGLIRQEDGGLLWFDLNGNLEKINKMDRDIFILDKARIIDNQIYYFNSNTKSNPEHFQVNVTDINMNNVTKSLFKTNVDQISRGRYYTAFSKYEDNVTLHLPYSQNLYTISSDTIWNILEVNFNENNIPDKLLKEYKLEKNFVTQEDALEMNKKIPYYALIKQIIPLKDKIYITFLYKHQRHGALINLENNHINVFKTFFHGILIRKLICYQEENNILYFEISPEDLQNISEKNLSIMSNSKDIKTLVNKNEDLINLNSCILKLQL